MKKKLLSLFVSLTMVMSLFSGVGTVFTTTALAADDDTGAAEATEAAEPVDATEVILDQIFVSLEAGESITLKGTVLPVNADDTSITWSSSDESVATVEGGTVTAIGNGYAVITATNEASGLFAECEIKVIFNDVSRDELSSGAYESINWAAENGIIRGFNGGEYFGTEESLTREQFAIMLWRLAGKPGADTSVLSNFRDADQISNSTAKKAIAWAYSEGLVKGFSDGTFGPKDELTRAQMAIVLWRMQGKQSAASAGFSDVTSTTTGVSAINWASAKGIVKGYSDGTYRPESDITRAEFTVMLYRYDNRFGEDTEEIAADNAVEKVSAIGYVAADGAKVSAVVVEYSEALFKAEVSTDTYDVWSYLQDSAGSCELGGDPAAVTAVYVNDKAETDEDPTGFGRYVIIELNTDFQLNQSVTYNYVMAADVTQTEDITAGRTTILSSGTAFTNYTANSYEQTGRDGTVSTVTEKIANSSEYYIEDIGRYDIGIIHTTNAFEEATGEYVDLDLDYAIYVPEDYDPEQEYMMMLHIEDAGNLGNDARLVLTEAQTPVNMISDEIQQYAKDQGYGGIIIVCPQITEDYRSTRDNYTFSAAVYATWDLVDMVIEEYNIDTDRIYGSGQSMGGMQVLEMAVQRDNFFAGILATGCQWGQNYNQEAEYSGNVYYTAPADGEYIWTVDSDGNPCDYKNFYYLISDDNVLCSNCVGDSFSTSVWTELAFLYEDLAGAEIPKATWNPLTTSVEDQNAMLEELVATESDLGIYWNAFEGGNHMATWVYADRVDSMYYWLLDQTRESEMERDKLDLDGDFELADEQITTADRLVYEDTENPENSVYYVTGKAGAGTAGYNSGQYSPRGGAPDKNPGWTVGIVSVTAIGFVDLDGAKLQAIAVEYNAEINADSVGADTYEISVNIPNGATNNGEGEIGSITAVYVNDEAAVSEDGGTDSGNYVIIEVYTDYYCSSEQTFTTSLRAGVTQVGDIEENGKVIAAASEDAVTNYEETQEWNEYRGEYQTAYSLIEGGFDIPDISTFKFYTASNTQNVDIYGSDGDAFIGYDCFDEKTGETYDEMEVAYALSLPEDYSEDGTYAMVVLDNPAASEGTHPLQSVLETRSPSVYASEWAQDLVKETHGLDGLIVVVPVVTARVDDNACSPAQYDALVQLWDYIQETYHVDENYVYGSGQSVGGMVLLETNRNRDNYFAGLLLYEDQWAQNYYKDGLFVRNMASDEETAATAPFHYPRTNGDLTWDYYLDTEGNPVYEDHDPNNYYYLISDDNILIMNRTSNYLSNDTWQELAYLYEDLAGYEFERLILDGNDDLEAQEETITEYLERENTLGLNWISFENGSNGYTCRKVDAGYEWLLTQSRETEIKREKLDINKPFELADEQITDESRVVENFTDADGNTLYYLTGKEGAGTQFYNTCWLNLTTVADAAPGWLPEGMSWETGVSGAKIEEVIQIDDNTLAIKYDAEMEDLVVNLKGDAIIGLDGNVREDITIALDPFDFYDEDGNELDVSISNIYVNSSAEAIENAERQSGSGQYVIVELERDDDTKIASIIQRTTLRTNLVIASASAKEYAVTQ